MLPDRLTGSEREVDVCVEGTVGGSAVKVCVECRDHARPADVSWVEMMKTKHERLPTNALILVSRSGFTAEAQKVAAQYGIQVIALQDLDRADVPALLATQSSLWTKSVTVTAEKVIVTVLPSETLGAETVGVMPDNLIYTADGTELGSIGELVHVLLNSAHARNELLNHGQTDHVWFELIWEPPRDRTGRPLFLKKLVPLCLREIGRIEVKGPCEFKVTEFGLRRGILGEIKLAWGKTKILEKDALVVATRDPSGQERLSVSVVGSPPGTDGKSS